MGDPARGCNGKGEGTRILRCRDPRTGSQGGRVCPGRAPLSRPGVQSAHNALAVVW